MEKYKYRQLRHLFEKAYDPDSPASIAGSMGESEEGKKQGQTWYVRCHEADGSDYLYQTCNSKEQAQAIVDGQDSNDALYEHLYVTNKMIEDIIGES